MSVLLKTYSATYTSTQAELMARECFGCEAQDCHKKDKWTRRSLFKVNNKQLNTAHRWACTGYGALLCNGTLWLDNPFRLKSKTRLSWQPLADSRSPRTTSRSSLSSLIFRLIATCSRLWLFHRLTNVYTNDELLLATAQRCVNKDTNTWYAYQTQLEK